MTPDPKAYLFPQWSPYVYCLDNPLNFIDYEGEEPFDIVNNAITIQYERMWNYANDLKLKYAPAIYDYASTATGIASYAIPPLAIISFELKLGATLMKIDNPYYQTEDIIGDVSGLIVSIVDPITGEIVNITIDQAYKLGYLTKDDIEQIKNNNHHIPEDNQENQNDRDDNSEEDEDEKEKGK